MIFNGDAHAWNEYSLLLGRPGNGLNLGISMSSYDADRATWRYLTKANAQFKYGLGGGYDDDVKARDSAGRTFTYLASYRKAVRGNP